MRRNAPLKTRTAAPENDDGLLVPGRISSTVFGWRAPAGRKALRLESLRRMGGERRDEPRSEERSYYRARNLSHAFLAAAC